MNATEAQVNPRLAALAKAGTSPWLDQIRRTLVEGGELARMVRQESLRGVTSNPSIFEKAILGSTDYDEELEAAARDELDASAIYERLAMHDVQAAADVLAQVHDAGRAGTDRDGLVSMEVAPELAHDAQGTLAMARSYWQRLGRRNVMIKIPGTREGVKAIEEAIYEGININVTLLFAVEAYERVAEAYLRGLERRLAEDKPLEVNSVASFFVSRVDTAVDKRLAELGHEELGGKAAIANARANSGLWLGAVLGELALQGRDKLTFVVSEPIESCGLWAEQLIAESTGKRGRGIVPIVDEPLGPPEVYGEDRVFLYLRNADTPNEELDRAVDAIAAAGHPTLTLATHGPVDLGRIFFLAEFATAVAGWTLEINPFDQPNVQAAKDNTQRVLESGVPEIAVADDDALRTLLGDAGPPHYIAILGYLPPSDALDAAIAELRGVLRAATGAATTFGYGPPYLHSTGQLHKGGPPVGRFLQLVSEMGGDVEIPGAGFSFATLIAAQAAGDLETLRAHGLPAERVRLEGDPVVAVRSLAERLSPILSSG